MTVHQLPGRVREFVNHLNGLLARLDQGAGWCAVFWQRDPDGMRACLDGREVPPWDVVEALLQDLAAEHGPEAAAGEARRLRSLHAAALAAHDARPGGRDALGDRLDVMLREQRYAADRLADLGSRLASAATDEQADAIRLDLAWAHDDQERATARCAELRRRMADLDRHPAPPPLPHPHGRAAHDARSPYGDQAPQQSRPTAADGERTAPTGLDDARLRSGAAGAGRGVFGVEPASVGAAGGRPGAEEPVPAPEPVPRQRKRRRGSARFAGMAEEEEGS
ncbi:hypothetical protein ACFVYK_31040, partial [Streptomyces sp. NPDC058291]